MGYNNKKTKTLKKMYNKTKKYHKKTYGGEEPVKKEGEENTKQKEDENTKQKGDESETQGEEGLEDIKEEREKRVNSFATGIGDSAIVKDSIALTEGAAVLALEGMGDLVGVDLEHPEKTTEQLNTLVKNSAVIGEVALEAAEPFIQPMVDKTIDVASKSASKVGESGVKILLNTAEEVPGLGVVIGTVRSLSNLGEAVISMTDAASQITTTFSDTINASSRNFSNLLKQKGTIAQRTNDSIQTFNDSNVSSSPVPIEGGGPKSKIKRPTRKKVRFYHCHNKSYKFKKYNK